MQDILRFKTGNQILSLDQASVLAQSLDKELSEQLLNGVPLAVLMGFSEFYHHKFFVNQHVLIPRPETEYMVDLLVAEFKGKSKKILDMGTGSGIIILSLINAGVGLEGLGVDISKDALEVAGINRSRLRLDNKVKLICSDRFSQVEGIFDLIVSNPPYIKATSHRSLVHHCVDKHEPHQALFLKDEEYASWFRDFFLGVKMSLSGTFMMEGHELELDSQAQLLLELGFEQVEVIKDLSQSKRFLKASFHQ